MEAALMTSQPQPCSVSKVEESLLAHWRGAYLLALRIVNDAHLAEDVVQEAFLGALPEARRNPPRDARTWILRITANKAKSSLRAGHTRLRLEASMKQTQPQHVESTDERKLALQAHLKGLDEKYRIPLSLHYEQGLTFNEVATVAGIPAGTAATLVSRGLERLREALLRDGYELTPALLIIELQTLGSSTVARPEFLAALKTAMSAKGTATVLATASASAAVTSVKILAAIVVLCTAGAIYYWPHEMTPRSQPATVASVPSAPAAVRMAPAPAPVPADHVPNDPVKIQDGAANLLREINCSFKGKTVAVILASLCETLEVRGRLSTAADTAAGEKLVDLELGEVTGAQALDGLATKACLKLQIRNGEVVLEARDEPAPPERAPATDGQF